MRRVARPAVVVALVAALVLSRDLNGVGAEAPTAGSVRQQDRVSVYGYVQRVVLEPSVASPTRMQVWGTFIVAGRAPDVGFYPPASGYLYFDLPPDPAEALKEWAELRWLGDRDNPLTPPLGRSNYVGILGFGAPGAGPRVRTSDEPRVNPDLYRPGPGVLKGYESAKSPAVAMLGEGLLNPTRPNYAVVDRVVLEPDASRPDRVQISGIFAIGQPDGASYSPPQRGYLYFTVSSNTDRAYDTRLEWKDWAAVAGARQVVYFLMIGALGGEAGETWNVRVRPADEKPAAPDLYRARLYAHWTGLDPQYAPVKALLSFR